MSRRCEVYATDQAWRPAEVRDLRVGQVFRLFEESGAPVVDGEGCARWMVLDPPVPNEDGTYDVEAEALPETDVERAVRNFGLYWPGTTPSPRAAGRSRLKG